MKAPPVRLPSIDGLRAFEAAARLGSFERAANELDVTPSAVSKRVATVEELLGEALFARGANTLALTATGRDYFAQISGVLSQLASMPLHHRTVQRRDRVRITAPPTFARQILVPRLQEFTSQYPDIDIEVVISMPVLDAPPTDADVEIRNGNVAQSNGAQLMQDIVGPMASDQLISSSPRIARPQDLQQVQLLRTPLESWVPWFRAAGLDWPEPVSGPKLVDLGLTIEAAVAGQGIALIRPSLANHWLASGKLRPLFALTVVPANQYYLLPCVSTGPAAVFASWLRAVCDDVSQSAERNIRAPFSC